LIKDALTEIRYKVLFTAKERCDCANFIVAFLFENKLAPPQVSAVE
jgi:hypothetical protein